MVVRVASVVLCSADVSGSALYACLLMAEALGVTRERLLLESLDAEAPAGYPFDQPWVAELDLTFTHPLTILVGENGTGKSTLIEAVAAYAPARFVERVQKASEQGDTDNPALVSIQRKEWRAIFDDCLDALH